MTSSDILKRPIPPNILSYFGIVAAFVPVAILSTSVNVNWCLMIIMSLVIAWLCIFERALLIKYFYWILVAVWAIVDVFALETWPVYLPNLKTTSFYTGGLAIRVAGFVVLIAFLGYFDRRHSRKVTDTPIPQGEVALYKSRLLMMATLFAYALLALALLDALRSGYFASGASSRYEYQLNASDLSSSFYPLLRLLLPIVALHSRNSRSGATLVLFSALFLLYLVLIGNKFGALLIVINLALVSYVFPFESNEKNLKRVANTVLLALVVFAGLLVAYSLFQAFYEKGSIDSALDKLFDRIFTGQGDVWWGLYAGYSSEGLHLSELGDELQAFNSSELSQIQYDFGIYKMMALIAPESVLSSYATVSARFAASTEASFFYYFGYFGVLASQVIVAWMASKITNELIVSCRLQKLVPIVCLGLIFNYALSAASMSEFYKLLSPLALLCYGALFICSVLQKDKKAMSPQSDCNRLSPSSYLGRFAVNARWERH